jgi:hypothetical protein
MRNADPVFVGWALVPTARAAMVGTSAHPAFHARRVARSAMDN